MRKLGVWVVIFSMIFSIFSFYPSTWKHVKGASSNKEALDVAGFFKRKKPNIAPTANNFGSNAIIKNLYLFFS